MCAKESESQRLGRHAEAAFAAAVVSRGHLWHPTFAGNDFGVDGVLELVGTDGTVTGQMCNVQVKAMAHLSPRADGAVPLNPIKLSTVSYWFSRISPTLLVLWSQDTQAFACQWAHEVLHVPELISLTRTEQKTVSLVLTNTNMLDAGRWQQLEEDIGRLHRRSVETLNERHIRDLFEALLCCSSDTRDILVEWVTAVAYCSPGELATKFAEEDSRDDLLKSLQQLRLSPPRIMYRPDALALIAQPIHHLRTVFAAFISTLRNGWRMDSDNPVLSVVETFAARLDRYYASAFPPDQRRTALSWGDAWDPETMGQVGFWIDAWLMIIPLINLLLRDFERELRGLIFPRLEPLDERSRWLDHFAREFVTPTDEWHKDWKAEKA